jgi:hypothetical protein
MQRNTGANAKGAKVTQKSQKGMPKIIWEMLEPVFMRVAGHKWLGRRMGAGCRCFVGFAAVLGLGWNECGNGCRGCKNFKSGLQHAVGCKSTKLQNNQATKSPA